MNIHFHYLQNFMKLYMYRGRTLLLRYNFSDHSYHSQGEKTLVDIWSIYLMWISFHPQTMLLHGNFLSRSGSTISLNFVLLFVLIVMLYAMKSLWTNFSHFQITSFLVSGHVSTVVIRKDNMAFFLNCMCVSMNNTCHRKHLWHWATSISVCTPINCLRWCNIKKHPGISPRPITKGSFLLLFPSLGLDQVRWLQWMSGPWELDCVSFSETFQLGYCSSSWLVVLKITKSLLWRRILVRG